MERKSGGWEKIILIKTLGRGGAQSLSQEANEWQLRRLGGNKCSEQAQWEHPSSNTVTIESPQRSAKSSCWGVLALLGKVPVSLWCCGIYSFESGFWHKEHSPCCLKSCFVPSGAAECSRWQLSLLVWFSWLAGSQIWVPATGTENSSKRELSALYSELFNGVPSTLRCQVGIRHKHILPLCYLVLFLIALWKGPPA